MQKYRFWAILIVVGAVVLSLFVYNSEKDPDSKNKFRLGLDLSGGTHLVYRADTSSIASTDVNDSMNALRDTIEKRINLFGVSEPLVQVEKSGVLGSGGENRLIVELPGVTDINEAVRLIGQTPSLEFKLLPKNLINPEAKDIPLDKFVSTGLSGKMLKRASVQFDPNLPTKPIIGIAFNDEGKDLFAKITRENTGDILGIFLDGQLVQSPYIREEIPNGEAVITGDFTAEQAKEVVRNLNFGALPVAINLVGSQSIGPTLGEAATKAAVLSGLVAFIVVSIFLLFWYRLPGLVSVIGLFIYTVLNLVLFKLIPVTLTAAGMAGFILSLGMAVDANILIFERMKEELKKGKKLSEAMEEGFHRAWSSIRDSNLSSIITAVILYYFASTPVIKGFALVFFIGVLVSMFSAITASRSILFALNSGDDSKLKKFLFSSGLH